MGKIAVDIGGYTVKTIIAFRGVANIGKSTTIKKTYELLLGKYPSAIIERRIIPPRVDISVIITINGKKIGIDSQGDPCGKLADRLHSFVEVDCQVIICATRTRGETVKAVNQLKPSYDVLWISRVVEQNSSEQESANHKMAQRIVEEAEKLIHT